MRITANRFVSDSDTTISQVFVDGRFVCFGLEDEYRAQKVKGETRIPEGVYNIGIRDAGGFHSRYTRRFGHFHQGMLQIVNVPGFEYILIHCGNTDKDTAGCLLVGEGAITTPGNMMITQSVAAYKKLYADVIHAALNGNLDIGFIDADMGRKAV